MIKGKFRIKLISLLTAIFFTASTFGAYAQQAPAAVAPKTQAMQAVTGMLQNVPEVQMLSNNLGNLQNSLSQIEQIATPLYNKLAPSNMESMTIAEKIKAIIGNTKTTVQNGVQSYKGQVTEWNAANGITPDTSFEQELGVGLNQLGVETSKMPLNGNGNAVAGKLKTIIDAIKSKLQAIITMIKAKITALVQKIGLGKKKTDSANDPSKDPSKEQSPDGQPAINAEQAQYADTFSGKLAKGAADGAANAKQSLKSSFSFSNLAVTTAVSVGTHMAIQMVNGQKPSLKQAVGSVATLEFAGSVAGSALGAAGGQFAASMVKAFLPGPIGALVGTFVPVLFGSAGAIMGGSLANGAKNGQFSIMNAVRQIDPVDLIGSSIGSTIGMMLGAPIPIIGPIIGGIVGGFLGSKVAKWASNFLRGKVTFKNFFRPSQTIPSSTNMPLGSNGNEISIGNNQGTLPTMTGAPQGTSVINAEVTPNSANPAIRDAEKKYYETYLQYNRLVEGGKYDEAKKLYGDLKTYSDNYNTLKNQEKSVSGK